MNFNKYQEEALKTRLPTAGEAYTLLGIAGEVGELLSLVAKGIRDEVAIDEDKMKKELGDILWFIAAIASDLEIKLDDVAKANIEKLAKRKENNTITGSGDDR